MKNIKRNYKRNIFYTLLFITIALFAHALYSCESKRNNRNKVFCGVDAKDSVTYSELEINDELSHSVKILERKSLCDFTSVAIFDYDCDWLENFLNSSLVVTKEELSKSKFQCFPRFSSHYEFNYPYENEPHTLYEGERYQLHSNGKYSYFYLLYISPDEKYIVIKLHSFTRK